MFPTAWFCVIFAFSRLERRISPLFATHYQTQLTLTSSSLFALHYLLFHCPFLCYSKSPGFMYQWHTVLLCGRPTSGTAVSHMSASSFNRYRQGLSLRF